MVLILYWIEARGKAVITPDSLKHKRSATMIDLDPLQVARELWSWLNLTLEHSSSAQRTFHLVEELNGAEIYCQLVSPLGITKASVKRRSNLRDKVQNPARAKNWQSILDALADWNANKLAFAKAGGIAHSDKGERDQLHKILPAGISHDMLSHAHDQPDAQQLVEWRKEKAIFIAEYGGGSGGAHVVDADAGVEPPPSFPKSPAWSRQRRYEEDEEE